MYIGLWSMCIGIIDKTVDKENLTASVKLTIELNSACMCTCLCVCISIKLKSHCPSIRVPFGTLITILHLLMNAMSLRLFYKFTEPTIMHMNCTKFHVVCSIREHRSNVAKTY